MLFTDIKVTRMLIGLSFTICPHTKNGSSAPPTTKAGRWGGGGFVSAGYFFLATATCVLGW